MKHIDKYYKDWCGEHHTVNSCHPVHDSAEACDFAEYYYKEKINHKIEESKLSELAEILMQSESDLASIEILKAYITDDVLY